MTDQNTDLLADATLQSESETRFHHLIETMEDAYYEVDLRGNLVFCNSAYNRLLGYSMRELVGMNNRQYQSAPSASQIYRIFNAVYQSGKPIKRAQVELRHQNGSPIFGECSVQLVRDADGRPSGFRGIIRDLTHQLKVEQALRDSEDKYRSILDTSTEAYFEVDLKGHLVKSNGAFLRMLGYTASELMGQNYRGFQDPVVAEKIFQIFNQVYRTGEPANRFDWSLICKDGSTVLGEGSVQLVRNIHDEPIGFCGFLRDVTQRRKVEQALRESEEKYRGILETIEDPYYEVDLQGNVVMCNEAMCRLTGYTSQELLGKNTRLFQLPEFSDAIRELFNKVFDTGQPAYSEDWPIVHKNGSLVWGEGSVQLVLNSKGEKIGFRGIVRNITQRRNVEQALRQSEARFRALTNLSSDWYWEQDAEFRFTRLDSHHVDTEMMQRQYLGKTPWELGLKIEYAGGWQPYREALARHESFRNVVMHGMRPDGAQYYISVSAEPVYDIDGRFTGYRGITRDITDQKVAEERIHYLATHDALTGLPNRTMFGNLLSAAIADAKRSKGQCAVLFIDLDRFKYINDTLGHESGDQLLVQVSARFCDALPPGSSIARLGGDEFVVVIRDLQEEAQAAEVARRLLSAAIEPVTLIGRDCQVSASIGISIYPQDGENEQALMKNADIAMFFAKEEGKNNFQFYSKNIRTQSFEHLVMENNLRYALERGEFSLHYQAKRNLNDGRVTGVEALLRWRNDELGLVSPLKFIPIAEETGLIIEIGKWVLRTACAQLMQWQRMGMPPISLAVNLSVRQFGDEHLLDDIAAILKETGFPPALLELEITESMVIHNPAHARQLLGAIKKMGLRLAIDDFGTGYSSLGQLKHFPIDILKVDRSFIRDLATNTEDKAITGAIIAMGKALNLTVVAEGAETQEQEAFLRELGCDEMQGYYFSRPLPAEEMEKFLGAQLACM